MSRSIIFDAPGHAVLIDEELRHPLSGEISVEAELSLVSSGTERTMLMKAPTYPVYPGYSMVGHVTAVGPGVAGFSIGDRVLAHTGHASHAVVDSQFALKLPEKVKSEDAVFFVIGAMGIYTVRLANLRMGDPLLIFGQGLIGLVTTQVARLAGAAPIAVVDVAESRLELARQLGADCAFHAQDKSGLDEWLRSLPCGGPAAAIDLCGIGSVVDTAVSVTRRGGRVVAASLVPGGHQVDVFGRAWMAGVSIVGAYFNSRPWRLDATETTSPLQWPVRPVNAGRYQGSEIATSLGDMDIFMRMLSCGRFSLQDLVDEVVAPADAPAMFMNLPHSNTLGHIIRWR